MRKKIFFNWDFPVSTIDFEAWDDGLSKALRIMMIKYDVEVIPLATQDTALIYQTIEEVNPDIILCWGSLDRPSFGAIKQFNKPTALCFAGGATSHGNKANFDVIFVENQQYVDDFKKQGIDAKRAFGVNEGLFLPTITMYPHFRAIYPAAFIRWKRHKLFAEAVGETGLAVGTMLDDETSRIAINHCLEYGTMILPQVPYSVLPFLMSQAATVVIAADAGSQRTTLEAMSMNKPVIVTSDNEKNCEYVRASGVGMIVEPTAEAIREAVKDHKIAKAENGRNFIMQNYTSEMYADALWRELQKL